MESIASDPLLGNRHSSPISVVLFDLGGVLVELNGEAPMLRGLGYRMPTEELWRKWLHSPSVRDFETGKIAGTEFAQRLIGEFEIQVGEREFLEAFTSWPTGLFPGALELVAQIPRRYVRAVLSNTNELHWPRVRDEMEIGGAFDHYFVSHLTGRIKPDAAAFEHVVESLRCSPAEVLFLDDNLLNVEAARRVGMEALVVRGAEEAERALRGAQVLG